MFAVRDRAGFARIPVAGERPARCASAGRAPRSAWTNLSPLASFHGIADARRGHRVDLAGDAAGADLAEVARVVGVGDRLAVAVQVVGEAEARREVVEAHRRIGAGEADRRQPARAGSGWPRSTAPAPGRGCSRSAAPSWNVGAAVRERVLHVGRDVGQLVDACRRRASGCAAHQR